MENLSEYDIRQLLQMSKVIHSFEKKEIDLNSCVGSLIYLFQVLETSGNASWEDRFFEELTTLETINALEIIEASESQASQNMDVTKNQDVIRTAVLNLKKLITSTIDNFLLVLNPNILESATTGDVNWLICPKCYDAWESRSLLAMVICPNCSAILRNPERTTAKEK